MKYHLLKKVFVDPESEYAYEKIAGTNGFKQREASEDMRSNCLWKIWSGFNLYINPFGEGYVAKYLQYPSFGLTEQARSEKEADASSRALDVTADQHVFNRRNYLLSLGLDAEMNKTDFEKFRKDYLRKINFERENNLWEKAVKNRFNTIMSLHNFWDKKETESKPVLAIEAQSQDN